VVGKGKGAGRDSGVRLLPAARSQRWLDVGGTHR
jgi:hypothetical protein